MLPQTGCSLPQPGLSIASPLFSGSSTYVCPLNSSSPDVLEKDYQIVTYEELEKLLPEPKPTSRVELGLLPNGCAYAPKTASRENYLLFASKYSYILYFTHHYFSRENLCRDQTFLNMLVDRLILPIEKLIKAPRLAALNTTHEEVEQALLGSKIVCVEDMNAGMRGVRRIDGYPGWSVNPDGVTHVQPLPDNPQNLTSLMRSFTLHSPYPISREISSNSQPVIMTSAGFENFRRDSIELNREEVKRSALIQTPVITNVCTMPASQSPLPVPILSPICDPNSSSGQLLGYSNATSYSVPYDGDMLQWALQNSLKQNNPYSPVAHVLVPHPVNHPSAMQLNKSQSLGCYFHPHAILPTFNSTQSGDLRSVGTLPIRGQPPLSSFCIPQTPNVTDSYRAAYPIPETNDASQPFNQAVAVALASMSANSRNHVNVHQRALHSHFSNQLITNSSNIGSIGTNQQQPMSHLHALATMSAAAHHQNVSPSCILNSITRTPFRMSTPLPLPVYYAASQIPFQTVIPQNAFNQLHSTVHPMHNYIYRAVDKIGSCESSDILKLDSNCSLSVPNLTQRTNKSMCPLFLLPALQIQKNKSHAPNLNTSELQIPSARRAASSAGLTSIHTSSKAVNARGNMSGAGTPAFTSPLPKTNFPATKLTVGDTTENVFDVTRNTISDRRPVLPVTTSSNESPYGIVISKDDSGRTCKQVDNVTSPGSVHDSEDSVSSGIGDMTAATANQNDSQNNSRTATRIVAKCKYTRDKSSSQIKGKMTRM